MHMPIGRRQRGLRCPLPAASASFFSELCSTQSPYETILRLCVSRLPTRPFFVRSSFSLCMTPMHIFSTSAYIMCVYVKPPCLPAASACCRPRSVRRHLDEWRRRNSPATHTTPSQDMYKLILWLGLDGGRTRV